MYKAPQYIIFDQHQNILICLIYQTKSIFRNIFSYLGNLRQSTAKTEYFHRYKREIVRKTKHIYPPKKKKFHDDCKS